MDKITIIPQEDSILLKRSVKEKQTNVGFIIPEVVGEAQAMIVGTITTMGIDKPYIFKTAYGENIEIYDGQKVLFEKGRGTPVYIEGEEYIFLNKRFVVALYDEPNDK